MRKLNKKFTLMFTFFLLTVLSGCNFQTAGKAIHYDNIVDIYTFLDEAANTRGSFTFVVSEDASAELIASIAPLANTFGTTTPKVLGVDGGITGTNTIFVGSPSTLEDGVVDPALVDPEGVTIMVNTNHYLLMILSDNTPLLQEVINHLIVYEAYRTELSSEIVVYKDGAFSPIDLSSAPSCNYGENPGCYEKEAIHSLYPDSCSANAYGATRECVYQNKYEEIPKPCITDTECSLYGGGQQAICFRPSSNEALTNIIHLKGGAVLVLPDETSTVDAAKIRIIEHPYDEDETSYVTRNYGEMVTLLTIDQESGKIKIHDKPYFISHDPSYTLEGESSSYHLIGTSGYTYEKLTQYGTLTRVNLFPDTGLQYAEFYVPEKQTEFNVYLNPLVTDNVAKVESDTYKLNLKAKFTNTPPHDKGHYDIGVMESFTENHFPELLKTETITDDNTEYTYKQEIKTGAHFVDFGKALPETDEPILYVDSSYSYLNYTLEISFSPSVSYEFLKGKEIVLFGKTYTVSDKPEETKNIDKFLESPGHDGGIITLYNENEKKFIFEDGQSVTAGTGEDSIDGTKVTIMENDDGEIQKIRIGVSPYSMFPQRHTLKQGEELTDPVFGSFTWQFAGPSVGLRHDSAAHVKISPIHDDRVRLEFTSFNGAEYSLDMFRMYVDEKGERKINVSSGPYTIQTSSDEIIQNDEFFILGTGKSQRILQLQSLRSTADIKEIRVKDVATGGTTKTWLHDGETGTMTYDGTTYKFKVIYSRSSVHTIWPRGIKISLLEEKEQFVGICKEKVCTEEWDPVCSVKGTTYSNSCYAEAANVEYFPGECVDIEITTNQNAIVKLIKENTYFQLYRKRRVPIASADGVFVYDKIFYDNVPQGKYDTEVKLRGHERLNTILETEGTRTEASLTLLPFLKTLFNQILENKREFKIIIGASAAASDNIAALDVASSLRIAEVMLDNEVVNTREQNLIVIGGPCANAITSSLMGDPVDCTEGFIPGTGFIQLLRENYQPIVHDQSSIKMIVAGYSADDTRRLGVAIRKHDLFTEQFEKKVKIDICGDSIEDVQFDCSVQTSNS